MMSTMDTIGHMNAPRIPSSTSSFSTAFSEEPEPGSHASSSSASGDGPLPIPRRAVSYESGLASPDRVEERSKNQRNYY